MQTISLNGVWELRIIGENIYGISTDAIEASVPGTMYSTLLEQKLIPDPYYRDTELTALKLMENEFTFSRKFSVTEEMMVADQLLIRLEGVDTLADIYVNDKLLGTTINMHRIWEFDLKELAKVGENEIQVLFHSPTKYIKEENAKIYTGGSPESMAGFPHIRKAACMFGWDWGPRLPDVGLFRNVSILVINEARIDHVHVAQEHQIINKDTKSGNEKNQVSCVDLDITVNVRKIQENAEVIVKVTVESPDGEIQTAVYAEKENRYQLSIVQPQLWWPNGYGKQPLYQVTVELYRKEDVLLDKWERRIGLRTVTMNTEKMTVCEGDNFATEVNGLQIFAMGADYIPEDNLFSRLSKERTKVLLQDCVEANYNSIRVWGGGYFPDDYFYDLCDEMGLVIWQDFLYACASYELDDAFEANIIQETIDNVRRIRHHACLGLWCGNNEMEEQVLTKAWTPSAKQKYDYIKMYEYIIPKIVKEEDPQAFYWPSSPSSGGNYDYPSDPNRGDAHYWDVWHGNKPFTDYRKYKFRYLSEFGFQSFPCMKTVESFTLPEDRNIFSRIMEMHQRNTAANGKIMNYMAATYLYPKDFQALLYASQCLQADAIRYGVEHFRRHRGICMGTVVWQLNDIWPVASWASIDYFGRWKALHYAEKKMFAPIMISCEEHGEVDQRPYCVLEESDLEISATLQVANETEQEVVGTVEWELCGPDSRVLIDETGKQIRGSQEVRVSAYDGVWLDKVDFSNQNPLYVHMNYRFVVGDEVVSYGTCLFTAPKHYQFVNPQIEAKVEEDAVIITTQAFAHNIILESEDGDMKFADNFFSMDKGMKRIPIVSGNKNQKIYVNSVYNIGN